MNTGRIDHETLVEEARDLLDSIESGTLSSSAYDTAWVARVPRPDKPDEPLFPASYDWLLQNQHPDGSWGAQISFPHDRVVSTLAALLALADAGYRRNESEVAARRAVVYLNQNGLTLRDDPAETVGFELILPELVRQAQERGLSLPYESWAFVEEIKSDKLTRIPPIAVYGGPTPLTHSLEYLGESLLPSLIVRARSGNGSYGSSPSATAYAYIRTGDRAALAYLQRLSTLTTSPAFPYVYPFDNFERCWILDALEPLRSELPQFDELIHAIRTFWTPIGMSWSSEWEVPDADDTAVALSLLSTVTVDESDVLQLYETPDWFQTFIFERNPSVTTNAHILSSIKRYQSSQERRRMTVKVIHYLENSSVDRKYWFDKWHVSPFYATCCAICALSGMSIEITRSAVDWVIGEQRPDGSWGTVVSTMEETAWAIWSLAEASAHDSAVRAIAFDAMGRGVAYLGERFGERDYEALWIGKCLYTPHLVVHAVVIGALARANGILGSMTPRVIR